MDDRFCVDANAGGSRAIVTRCICTTMARGSSETCTSRGLYAGRDNVIASLDHDY
jgi:hypothetical protein